MLQSSVPDPEMPWNLLWCMTMVKDESDFRLWINTEKKKTEEVSL